MRAARVIRRTVAAAGCVVLLASGCGFEGVNSLPLPGAAGRGPSAVTYRVEIANVATLEPNSPVMIDDTVVGSVRGMRAKGWHAEVEVSVEPDVVVPANAVARIGQTSLLGSMHLSLDPPPGEPPRGRLEPGATVALSDASTYPTTEQTLSALAAVVNGGGLGQIGDVIHNMSTALSGREQQIRDLLGRLDTFVGTLDEQSADIVTAVDALNRLAGTFAAQRDEITRALEHIPPALEVLNAERPRLTTALQRLGTFSDTATRFVNDSQEDLVRNLRNMEPALRALAAGGPQLPDTLAYALHFPFTESFIDRAIRGDYYNLFAIIDLTIPRLKRSLFLGTRWGQEGAQLVPAPGDPYWLLYTYDPLKLGIDPPPPNLVPPLGDEAFPPAPPEAAMPNTLEPPGFGMGSPEGEPAAPMPPMPPDAGPILPVAPQQLLSLPGTVAPVETPPPPPGQAPPLFAGPFEAAPAPGGGG